MKHTSERITPLQSDSLPFSQRVHSFLPYEELAKNFGGVGRLNAHESPEEIFLLLEKIIKLVYSKVKKTNNYIDEHIWSLSSEELVSHGEVFYMNPCLEYSLLTLQYMKNAGFDTINLIINELKTPYPNLYKLHFGLEGTHLGRTYFVDHITRNTVHLGLGKFASNYKDTTGEESVHTIVVDGKNISATDSFPDLYKKGLIEFEHFTPDALELFKKKFQKDNTPEEWENGFLAKVQHPDKPEILIQSRYYTEPL